MAACNLGGLRPLGKHYQCYSGTLWCAVQRRENRQYPLDMLPPRMNICPKIAQSYSNLAKWGCFPYVPRQACGSLRPRCVLILCFQLQPVDQVAELLLVVLQLHNNLPGCNTAFVALARSIEIVYSASKVLKEHRPVSASHICALVPPSTCAAHPAPR